MDHQQLKRCPWCGDDPLYQAYHDKVWGKPCYDSQELFAKLCLDGQQAGLSWITILRKQEAYYRAYDQFDPYIISRYGEGKIEALLADAGIVRNRLKVTSVVKNAQGYIRLTKMYGDFSAYLWQFVGGRPVVNSWRTFKEVPTSTDQSRAMSAALKKAGFSFVGPTICYAFMQAVGMVDDHLITCPQWSGHAHNK